ncbi:unnamed protein product [Prorocentrum cordatum]|uniref:Uncharacterized protein n=1 Tax=Prorocentrum cordatum TaxID=2364126 RepID=A0ABN9PR00_9DINO|nr:unnamed protein product [Polarella glacialis]
MAPKAQPRFVTCTACRFWWNFRKNAHCWTRGQSLELKPANPSPRNGVREGNGAGGAAPKASPKAKAAVVGGGPKTKAAAAGGAVDGRRGFPAAPWSLPGASELDKLPAIPDPTIAAKLREAVAEACDFAPPPPAAAQKSLEQQLQSATDRRINLQRQLDEAAGALLAAKEQLDERRGRRDTVATSAAEAQAEEAQLLRSRAQASGIAQPTPDASKSATFTFDVETLENFRAGGEGPDQPSPGAQAAFERNCQEQLQRFKKDIEEAAASKRRKRERAQPEEPAGASAQEPAAAAAAEHQAAPLAAAAEDATTAAAGGPASGPSGHAAQAAELGAAAAEAARPWATEQKVASAPAAPAAGDGAAGQFAGYGGSVDQEARRPAGTSPADTEVQSLVLHTRHAPGAAGAVAIRLEQGLPNLGPLALRQGSLDGDLRVCTYNGNAWNSVASVHEWMRRIALGMGTTIAMISIYLEDPVGLQGSNRQMLAGLHEWCAL